MSAFPADQLASPLSATTVVSIVSWAITVGCRARTPQTRWLANRRVRSIGNRRPFGAHALEDPGAAERHMTDWRPHAGRETTPFMGPSAVPRARWSRAGRERSRSTAVAAPEGRVPVWRSKSPSCAPYG
jgi:hypothetical protein